MSEIFAVFEEGNIISTRHGNSSNWIINLIANVNSKFKTIEIPLRQEYIKNLLMKGEQIDVRIGSENDLYIAKGVVKDIMLSPTQRVLVEINSVDKIDNKREDIRYDVHLNSIVKGEDLDDFGFAVVTDISKSGIGLLSKQNIPIGINVFADVFLDEGKVLKLKGRPIRKKVCGYDIKYGMTMSPVDDTNKNTLQQLLKELEEKENQSVSVVKRIRQKSISNE